MIQAVFQNEHFVVCNKPAQVLSVPSREQGDSRPCLGLMLQSELKTQIYPVHRLDYEVSGLIIYALNAQSHKLAQEWFIQKKIKKYYSALTKQQDFSQWPAQVKTDRTPILPQPSDLPLVFNWKTQILRGKKRSFESSHGEWAITEAQLSEVNEFRYLWKLYPVTGKPHQLRLELARRGFPIIGDQLYGSKENFSKGIALKAYELDLTNINERIGLPAQIQIPPLQITESSEGPVKNK